MLWSEALQHFGVLTRTQHSSGVKRRLEISGMNEGSDQSSQQTMSTVNSCLSSCSTLFNTQLRHSGGHSFCHSTNFFNLEMGTTVPLLIMINYKNTRFKKTPIQTTISFIFCFDHPHNLSMISPNPLSQPSAIEKSRGVDISEQYSLDSMNTGVHPEWVITNQIPVTPSMYKRNNHSRVDMYKSLKLLGPYSKLSKKHHSNHKAMASFSPQNDSPPIAI